MLRKFIEERSKIVLVSAIDEEVLSYKDSLWIHDKLNAVYVASFNPYLNTQIDCNIVRKREVKRLNKYGLPVQYLPQSLDPSFTSSLRNTGLITIHLAASRSDVVECIGYTLFEF